MGNPGQQISVPEPASISLMLYLLRSQINNGGDHGFYRDADDAMDEELLDELFAESGVKELL